MPNGLEHVEVAKSKGVNFRLSTDRGAEQGKAVVASRNEMADRISGIIEKATSNLELNPQLIPYLINLFKSDGGKINADNMIILGQVLIRLAKYQKEFEDLDERVKLINYAISEANWMAEIFGAFEEDVDRFIADALTPPSADTDSDIFTPKE